MPHSAATLDPNAPTSQTGITKFQSSSTGSGILAHFLAGIDNTCTALQPKMIERPNRRAAESQ